MESKINIHLKKQMFLLIGLISSFVFSQTPVTYTANPTNAQINTALNGNNISITGGTLNFGSRTLQIATFTGGTAAALQMSNGVFFGTGNVTKLLTTNTATTSTDDIPTAATFSDADLATVDNTATRDVVSYSFTVTLGPKATSLSIGYQFGSEEYPDYVGSNYDDALGFFVTGPGISGTANLARLPNNSPTSINKVNFGLEGTSGSSVPAFDGTQSALYINNGHDTVVSGGKLVTNTNPGPFPIAVQFNGITRLITYTLSGLTPNGTYTFKIVIADAGDATLDSGVFIDNIYATATLVANNDSYTIVSGSSSINSVLNNDSVNGTAPATLSDVLLSQISTTNAGVTLNPLTGQINVAPGTPSGTYAVTYQICDQTFTSNCKTAVATIIVQTDFDGDGVIDDNDLDDDNDGILDTNEKGACGPGSIISLKGLKGIVYNSTAILNAWAQINASSTFPTAGFSQIATFDYIEFANTSKAFDVDFNALGNISPTNIDMVNYQGTALNLPTREYAVMFSKTINADEVGTYRYNLNSGDNHVFVYKNGIKVAAKQNVYTTVLPDTNFLTFSVVVGDKIDILLVEEDSGNTYINITTTKTLGQCMLDNDNDGTPNHLDTDSDGDTCPDAVEGSENVSIEQVWPLNLPIADANYANRGKIKVIYDGITTNTQPNIVSQSAAALGVPQLVNNAGNNLNSITNPSDLAGLADNTDVPGPTTADIGQGVGASTNAAINACICYNDPNTGTVGADTKHGITLLKRAGATPQPDNWPMERKSAFTALESNTKGFVITRMTTAEINALTGQSGMMVYDTDLKCLKLFNGTAWSCFNTPTCP